MAQQSTNEMANEILDTFLYYPASYGPTIVARLLDFDKARQVHLELYSIMPHLYIGMRYDGDLARFFHLTFEEAVWFPLYCRINGF